MITMYTLLTGDHTGLGLGVTKKLLQLGNKIGLIIRSEKRKDQTISEVTSPENRTGEIGIFWHNKYRRIPHEKETL